MGVRLEFKLLTEIILILKKLGMTKEEDEIKRLRTEVAELKEGLKDMGGQMASMQKEFGKCGGEDDFNSLSCWVFFFFFVKQKSNQFAAAL